MSGTFQFTTPAFSVLSAAAVDARHVLVGFTAVPADPRPSKFVIEGHAVSAALAGQDPTTVLLTLVQPLMTGSYTVTVADLHTASGAPCVAPLAASFFARFAGTDLTDPARNDDAASTLKKHRTPALHGVNWDLLTAVVAASEQKNWDLARTIEDQLFLATASGKYLDRKGSHFGKERAPGVGMGDEDYRSLVIAITSGQVTPEAFLAALEVFYGLDATHAHLLTGAAQPFIVEDQATLSLCFDGRRTVDIVFDEADFDNALAATALEVGAVLNRAFKQAGVNAVAMPWSDPQTDSVYLAVYTGSAGLRGSVAVTDGSAQHWLRFPAFCAASTRAGQAWSVSRVGLMTRFTTSLDSLWAKSVRVGDYVLVRDLAFSHENHGSFKVLDLHWSARTGVAYFDILNPASVVENVLLTLDSGLEFFRGVPGTLRTLSRAAYLKESQNVAEVVLPATASVVRRRPGTAAYVHCSPPLALISGGYDTDTSVVTLVCAWPHGFSLGDQVEVEGLMFGVGGGASVAVNGCFTVTAVQSPTSFSYSLNPPVARPSVPVPPYRVEELVAVPGASTISLLWNPPLYSGSDPVLWYRVQVFDTAGAELQNTTTADTALVVGGLAEATEYLFVVHAGSSAGTSAAVSINSSTLAVPLLTPAIVSPTDNFDVMAQTAEISGTYDGPSSGVSIVVVRSLNDNPANGTEVASGPASNTWTLPSVPLV